MAVPFAASADEAGWAALKRPGAIVLMRHATAPGVGDPPGVNPEVCATQRNLDDRGRKEAADLGAQFRARRVVVGAVVHSRWCRATDTARLAFEGAPVLAPEPAFDSFFADPGNADRQTQQARAILRRWQGPGALVVVSHQVNITRLTGQFVSSAEGLVVRLPDGSGPLEVLGRIAP